MNKTEKEFFDTFNIGEPVIKKWYYDGYYEDFYWQDRLENCTKILEHYKLSIDEFNTKLQETKEKAKTLKEDIYDSYTDSINTQWGRMSKAFMNYPEISNKMYLELICALNENTSCIYNSHKVKDLKEEILKKCIEELTYTDGTKNTNLYNSVKEVFKEKE